MELRPCGVFDGGPGVVGGILRLRDDQRHGWVSKVRAIRLPRLAEHGYHHRLVCSHGLVVSGRDVYFLSVERIHSETLRWILCTTTLCRTYPITRKNPVLLIHKTSGSTKQLKWREKRRIIIIIIIIIDRFYIALFSALQKTHACDST